MALIATNQLPAEGLDELIREIRDISVTQGGLTPRSLDKIRSAASAGKLVVVFDGEAVAAWALLEPLTRKIDELGMTFVKPEYRTTQAYRILSKFLESLDTPMLMASYNQALIRNAVRQFGWKEATLAQVVWRSRGRFILKRLDRKSRTAVRSHLKTQKPLYAIWEGKR